MIETFLRKIRLVMRDETLRRRILFVFGALVIFRVLATIPVPGVDTTQLEAFFNNSQFLGLLNIFSGGGLSNLSIVALGVGPYITASIVMQLATVLSPRLKALYQEEGEAGRVRFMTYARYLTVPLAFLQGFSLILLFKQQGVITSLDLFETMTAVFILAGGSLLLMWLGELITEFGVGNGVSLIIFAGIVAALPGVLSQLVFTFDVAQIPMYLGFLVAGLLVTAAVVYITEAERPIPVTYSRQVRGGRVLGGVSTYLPIRVNQSGVMPIIFALSLLLFPQMIANFLANSALPFVSAAANAVNNGLANQWVYGSFYFLLVFVFTYFYTAITFEPNEIAKNLQKRGAFIPGIRPGQNTAEHLGNIITRITLVGALFLGIIAVLPIIMQGITGIATLTIGGTALLIAVSVILDVVKKIDAQTSIREY